jgi:hypothetical protein
MRLFNRSIKNLFVLRYKKMVYFSKYPEEQQEMVLKDLLRASRKTEWGILFDYKHILNSTQFSEKVPLNDYETLKGWIERMISGEKNILWPGQVKWFAKSSGTTNDKSKFIPVSKESLYRCHYNATTDIFAYTLKIILTQMF